jgi:hypothetical protein
MTFHAEKGLIDEYEVYPNPLVWGFGPRGGGRPVSGCG